MLGSKVIASSRTSSAKAIRNRAESSRTGSRAPERTSSLAPTAPRPTCPKRPRRCSILPPRHEQMSEQTGRPLDQLPTAIVRPKRREFATCKSGPDADGAVMTGDRAAAIHPEQVAVDVCPPYPARFEGNDDTSRSRRQAKQFGELLRAELVQKKIAENNPVCLRWRPPQPFSRVSHLRLDAPTQETEAIAHQRIKRIKPVNQRCFRCRPLPSQATGNPPQKMAIAGAQLGDLQRAVDAEAFLHGAGHDTRVPQPGVPPTKVAAGTQGAGILHR
jgi:hypothetical protein